MRRWLAGVVTFVLVGVAAAPAHAATSVTLPGHSSDFSTVRLLGASESGFMLEQGYSTVRLLAGAPSTALGSLGSPLSGRIEAKGAYGWYHEGSTVVRVDLATKARTTYPAAAEPIAFTPDGWLTVETGALVRHVAGGATTTLFTGIDTTRSQPEATADANGAVVLYDSVKDGVRDRYVGLVTFGKPGVEVVWQQSQGAIYQLQLSDVALSPTQVGFQTTTTFGGGGIFVHQRPRAGGVITTTAAPADVLTGELAAAGDALALPALGGDNYQADPSVVEVLSGGAWHTVTLPGPGGLLRSSGTRFYIGVTGKNTTAGVYGFGATGGATRVATLAAAPALPTGVALSAGYLTTEDDAVATLFGNGSLWRRPVSGSTSVTLGAETRLAPQVTGSASQYVTAPIEFSAARGVVRQPGLDDPRTTPFQLIDRGVVTRTLPQVDKYFDSAHVSGPYASVNRKVFRADGTELVDLGETNGGRLALFGKTLIYQSGVGTATKVLLRDLEKPATAPVTLASSGICDQNSNCGYGLAAWYDTVAWERLDGKVVVRTISSGASRVVDPGGGAGNLHLSDNALSWGYGTDVKLLDLGLATSTPVSVPNLRDAVVDGHLIAGRDPSTYAVVVKTLPFGSTRKTPVRLIGTLAPASFTTTWSPQFDLTKPATGVTLTLKKGTTTVRTLTGTAPDGSIRDLTWDGKNTAGARVAAGSYTFSLTANATDGEGALAPVSGTVTVR